MPATTTQFSHELRQEMANALNEFMSSPAASMRRLTNACTWVCNEGHAMYSTPAEMTAGVQRLYAELPGGGERFAEQQARRIVFDSVLRGRMKAYAEDARDHAEGSAGVSANNPMHTAASPCL